MVVQPLLLRRQGARPPEGGLCVFPTDAAALRHTFQSRDEPAATRTALAIYGIDAIPDEPDHA